MGGGGASPCKETTSHRRALLPVANRNSGCSRDLCRLIGVGFRDMTCEYYLRMLLISMFVKGYPCVLSSSESTC